MARVYAFIIIIILIFIGCIYKTIKKPINNDEKDDDNGHFGVY